ncbi:MAG: hypothetical protein MUE44_36475 [Oscillatoriaceae cyanobacterium Prado104]|nr:hypothetical protein [Oscillatoriaceae cyanobacterium Prado104]
MISKPLLQNLPSSADLPCSDDTPVDNEDQNLLPNLLRYRSRSITGYLKRSVISQIFI